MPKSAARGGRSGKDAETPLPPARTRERRTQQLVMHAEKLIEERLLSGEASPTETTAILRYGSRNEELNNLRIAAQTDLLIAQKAKAEAETINEERMREAIEAVTRYQGL